MNENDVHKFIDLTSPPKGTELGFPKISLAQCIGLYADSRDVLVEELGRLGRVDVAADISMPCGARAIYQRIEDLPDEDVPCTCGDPTHWIVMYRDREVKP